MDSKPPHSPDILITVTLLQGIGVVLCARYKAYTLLQGIGVVLCARYKAYTLLQGIGVVLCARYKASPSYRA